MRDIKECFDDSRSLSSYMNEGRIDEGLKDIFNNIKNKFKKAWEYLRGIVVKVGSYILPVDSNGIVQPVITSPTAGQAYKDGIINKISTFVHMDNEGSKITGLKNKFEDALSLYGEYAKGNSLKYFASLRESAEENWSDEQINEVRLQNQDPEAKYNVVVDNERLKKKIKQVIKSKNLARLMVWGAPGIGKTAILTSVLDEMKQEFPDYNLIVKTLSNETPDNFTLPKYIDVDGTEKATDIPKTWLPVYQPTGDATIDTERDSKCGKGLLFIDELSRATPQVLNVVLPLVNEGVFNGYKLGSGWTIICASNRAEDEMGGQTDIGNALSNRFSQIYYEPCVNTWRQWADKQNFISPLLTQWLSMPESENLSGDKFYYMDPNEDMDGAGVSKLICTPRSWTNAMRDLAEYSRTGTLEGFTIFDIDRDDIAYVLNQYVPAKAVDSFLAFLEVISHIGNFDAAVMDIWNNGGKKFKLNKKDLNKITIPLAQLICSSHSDSLPTEKEFISLANWLVAQGSDQLTSFVLDVFKNIFMGDVNESIRDTLFVIHAKKEMMKDDKVKWKLYSDMFAPFTSRWGIKLEKMPDYLPGLKIISEKFQSSFKQFQVDGVDALG